MSSPIRFQARDCVLEGERRFQPSKSSLPDIHSSTSKAKADGVCTFLALRHGTRRCANRRRNALCYPTFEAIANRLFSKHWLASCGFSQVQLMTPLNGRGNCSDLSYRRGEDEAEWPRVSNLSTSAFI